MLSARKKILWIALAVLVLCAITEAWNPPFSYTLRDIPVRDIVCSLPFSYISPSKTREAKEEARREVPHYYIHDNSKLVQFKLRFVNTVKALLTNIDYSSMSEEERESWKKFLPPETDPETAAANFALFQEDLGKDNGLVRFRGALDQSFQYFERDGFLLKLHDGNEGNQERILVYDAGEAITEARDVLVYSVLIGTPFAVRDTLSQHFKTEVADLLFQWIRSELVPTLEEDADATLAAQNAAEKEVQPVSLKSEPGQILARKGVPIDENTLNVLEKEYRESIKIRPYLSRAKRFFGIYGFLFVVLLVTWNFFHEQPKYEQEPKENFFGLMLFTFTAVAIGRIVQIYTASHYGSLELIPIMVSVLGLATALTINMAVMIAFAMVLVLSLSGSSDNMTFFVMMGATVPAIILVREPKRRDQPLIAAVVGGGVAFVLACSLMLFEKDYPMNYILVCAFSMFLWATVSGFILTGLLPFIEKKFHILTPLQLFEIGRSSNPLLVRLTHEAPATYHHSSQVSFLAGSVADEIKARGDLVRVAALFHDVGKLSKPNIFTENQSGGTNPHDNYTPAQSAGMIIKHVSDGVAIAKEADLPKEIIDIIQQHHGTTFAGCFYKTACEQANGQVVDEGVFRYKGPKPQSREAAILMLADATEAACRSLKGETEHKRIEDIVNKIVTERLTCGQLDDSRLTVGEIQKIRIKLVNVLITMNHQRVSYKETSPAQKIDKKS